MTRQIEDIKKELRYPRKMDIPYFETCISLFSIYASMLMFLAPNMLVESEELYKNMTAIMPQEGWALTFLMAAMIKVVGLIGRWQRVRQIGLLASVFIYGTIAICYALVFPNLGTGLFAILAIMSLINICSVNKTML